MLDPIRQANLKVLEYWKERLKDYPGTEHTNRTSLPYIVWFIDHALERGEEESFPIDKLGRWVGFVQGVLACKGWLDVDEERDRTRPLFQRSHG